MLQCQDKLILLRKKFTVIGYVVTMKGNLTIVPVSNPFKYHRLLELKLIY